MTDLDTCTFLDFNLVTECGKPATKWFHSERDWGELRSRCSDHLFRYPSLDEITREEAEVIAVMQS